MEDFKSNHNVYNIYYHITFTPKYRHPILVGEVEITLKESLLAMANEYKLTIIEMEVMKDHVHLFVSAPPSHSPSQLVR